MCDAGARGAREIERMRWRPNRTKEKNLHALVKREKPSAQKTNTTPEKEDKREKEREEAQDEVFV